MKPTISIIIPVYNSFRTLEKCVCSILNQTIVDQLEIILIDDGSSDGSRSLCQEYEREHNCISLICTDHKGISHSRNTGVSRATGNYIGFVDSDDYVCCDMYEKLLDAFADDEEIDVVVTSYNDIRGDNIVGKGSFYDLENKTVSFADIDAVLLHCYSGDQNVPCYITNYLIKRECVVPFDEDLQFMEDAEFLSRLFFRIRKIKFTQYHLYNYFYNEQGVTKNKDNVYRNIVDLTKAGKKISDNLQKFGKYEVVKRQFTKMQCFGIINKLMLLSNESLSDVIEILNKCARNRDVCDIIKASSSVGLSKKGRLLISCINTNNVVLASLLIKVKGFVLNSKR